VIALNRSASQESLHYLSSVLLDEYDIDTLANAILKLYIDPESLGITTNGNYLSIYLFIYLFIFFSIYLYIYLSIGIKLASEYMSRLVNPTSQSRLMFQAIWKIYNLYR
jgi:hypothetical protein